MTQTQRLDDVRAKSGTQGLEPTPQPYRLDIQGLRAVAVLLVVLYHAGLPWLPGGFVGVDIFFVISGFLITQGLVGELARRGSISLPRFYARRARRILPAAAFALVGVVGLALLLLPATRWLQLGRDVVTSSTYVVNWELASRSVNYMARDQAPSAVQHFWSLAVEEQFYLVWPLVLLLTAGVTARLRRGRRSRATTSRSLLLAFAFVAVPSLLWSIYLTSTRPGPAYFVTTTRMWELALGAGLAIAGGSLQTRLAVHKAVGWLGLAAIAVSAVTFTAGTPFPGYAALLPTLGAVAVLWGGAPGAAGGPAALLERRPMVWIGGLSYSLYLWHWPLIVIATAMTGTLRIRYGLAVAAVSFVPAWISLHAVERPVLQSKVLRSDSARSLQLGALCTLLGVVAGLGLQNHVLTQVAATSSAVVPGAGGLVAGSPGNLGAAALVADPSQGLPIDSFPTIVPSAITASGDAPQIDGHACTLDEASTAAVPCSFGDLTSTVVVALVGDSHADQLVPALERVAIDRRWRLDVYTRGSCPFTALTVDLDGRPYRACDERNANVTAALLKSPPAMLLVATSRYQVYRASGAPSLVDSKPLMAQGFSAAWKPFVDAGVPVVTFRDTPRPNTGVPDCVAENPQHLTRCAMDRSALVWDDAPEVTAAHGIPLVHVIDLTSWICPTDRCPAVIGGVLIYRDGNHLTATYARSLAPVVESELDAVLG